MPTPNRRSETIRLWCEVTFVLKNMASPTNLANEFLTPGAVFSTLLLGLFSRGQEAAGPSWGLAATGELDL